MDGRRLAMTTCRRRWSVSVIALGIVSGLGSSHALAEEEKQLGWSDTAEFSLVAVSGNAESSSLGFKNALSRAWADADFVLRAGGVRVETTTEARVVDAANPPALLVFEDSDVTAENYFLNGRYDRKITERFFWYGGAGWDRNEFAGVENRYMAFGGVGNIWWSRDDLKFRTDYAATYTDQEDVVGTSDSFAGVRFSWDYSNKLGSTTTYANVFILDENLDETSDWRGDMTHSLSVTMSERLALKTSLQWLYDNEPSFGTVTVDSNGAPVVPAVLYQLDELDTIFNVSLVVDFK
jgi:hypothetical protein